MASGGPQKDLLSSLVSDIKNYTGDDPLRPWLQGIRKMRESLPPPILKEKLPRFLQRCVQTFESNCRYRNDSRYLRVWIQLMDYVDDAKVLLKKMEKNHIGLKRAMFYSAYALYYEKRRKYDDAEKMYHMGVQNLAEPVDELRKAYKQFLLRMKLVKKRRAKLQEAMPCSGILSSVCHQGKSGITENNVEEGGDSRTTLSNIGCAHHHENVDHVNLMEECSRFVEGSCEGSRNCTAMKIESSDVKICSLNPAKNNEGSTAVKEYTDHQGNTHIGLRKPSPFCSDDTVVVKFVGSAIVGKSETEDACHHGLVDPTINMKEAMDAISSMFREPLESEPVARRSHRSKSKANAQGNTFEVFVEENLDEGAQPKHNKQVNSSSSGFEVFVDESSDNVMYHSHPTPMNAVSAKQAETEPQKPFIGVFKIWTDDDDDVDDDDDDDDDDDGESCDGDGVENKVHKEAIKRPAQSSNASVSSKANGRISSRSDETIKIRSEDVRLKEDTVIRRFMGSTVFDESEVENACHHGLVDPTINLKEAMDDINSMFGKPLNFVKTNKPKKQAKLLEHKPVSQGFTILADDDSGKSLQGQERVSCQLGGEGDLFESTVFTREAMAEINEMFGKPIDF